MRTFAQKQNLSQNTVSSSLARPHRATPRQAHHEHPIFHLQRTIGNQAVLRMLQAHTEELDVGLTAAASPRFGHDFSQVPLHSPATGAIQTKPVISKLGDEHKVADAPEEMEEIRSDPISPPVAPALQFDFTRIPLRAATVQRKPTVSSPGDLFEREADDVAEKVMRLTEPVPTGSAPVPIQRKCAECEDEEKKPIQTKPSPSAHTGAALDADAAVRTAERDGAPLSKEVRSYFEPRLGHDLSRVRVHADSNAAEAAREMRARAYTIGRNIVFASGEYAPATVNGKQLLAHELVHVIQQTGGATARQSNAHSNSTRPAVLQRQPQDPKADVKPKPATPVAAKGPAQRLYVVRDASLGLGGGVLVRDLAEFKRNVMRTKTETEWTLVLSIHGSENLIVAQAPPDWKKDIVRYEASDIDHLFGDDKAFVKWRDQYGPTYLSLVSCQVSASFEDTMIKNLTRAGAGGRKQSKQGLGAGCKPISTAKKARDAPSTRAAFDKLSLQKREAVIKELAELNNKWGYYGAPPVPEGKLLDYYYDEDPKGEWVMVEVYIGKEHDIAKLKPTGIPFWNRTTGKDAPRFRQMCDQGAVQLRGHTPTAPPDDE